MFRLFAILCVLLFTPAALAQNGPPAFAAVQAPEAGVGVCVQSGVDAAIACATTKCMDESGFGEEDCILNAVCRPAGWSADIFMQHQEGLHWHTYLCGWQSRAQAQAAAAVACISDYLIECTTVAIWDPDGQKISLFED